MDVAVAGTGVGVGRTVVGIVGTAVIVAGRTAGAVAGTGVGVAERPINPAVYKAPISSATALITAAIAVRILALSPIPLPRLLSRRLSTGSETRPKRRCDRARGPHPPARGQCRSGHREPRQPRRRPTALLGRDQTYSGATPARGPTHFERQTRHPRPNPTLGKHYETVREGMAGCEMGSRSVYVETGGRASVTTPPPWHSGPSDQLAAADWAKPWLERADAIPQSS